MLCNLDAGDCTNQISVWHGTELNHIKTQLQDCNEI